jgi:hypothetical protein
MNLQFAGFRLNNKKTKRGRTKVLSGHVMYHITEVFEVGQPCPPKKIKDTYVSQCGAIV